MIPLWLKEILDKGEIRSKFNIFGKDNQFAIIYKLTENLIKHKSLQELVGKQKDNKCIAFFRDGPFLPPTTGAVVSILGEMEALVDLGYNVYLFCCYRGWNDPYIYSNRKFNTVFINPEDFYTNRYLVSNIISKLGISICQFDSAEAVVSQASMVHPNASVVFEVHNIEYDLLSQFGAPENEINYIILKQKPLNPITK